MTSSGSLIQFMDNVFCLMASFNSKIEESRIKRAMKPYQGIKILGQRLASNLKSRLGIT